MHSTIHMETALIPFHSNRFIVPSFTSAPAAEERILFNIDKQIMQYLKLDSQQNAVIFLTPSSGPLSLLITDVRKKVDLLGWSLLPSAEPLCKKVSSKQVSAKQTSSKPAPSKPAPSKPASSKEASSAQS
uniref:Uncharacterized protein n=1 Tax=Glossina pallidipes TaxID=7398 RepID=A0A1A9ZV36_GLOPL